MHGGQHNGSITGIVARRGVNLLETAVVLLVNDNQPDVGIGQENRRTRPDDDLLLGGMCVTEIANLLPYLNPFVGAITRMIHTQTVTKIFLQAIDNLCSKSYFRQQIQHLFSSVNGFLDEFDVDFSLAARSDTMKQNRLVYLKSFVDSIVCFLLSLSKLY